MQRLLKGIFQSRPPTSKYKEIWDVQVVLDYLATLYPVGTLSLKQLSYKLVMLLLLVTGQRGQTIQLLDTNTMFSTKEKTTFIITGNIKQSRPGKSNPQIVLEPYEDSRICVVVTLEEYIKRTSDLRGTESKLLISYIKPYKPVSRDTITRWMREVMNQAGIDTSVYSSHSTRSASTSAAKRGAITLDDILTTAGWSSAQCFSKYYNKPITNGAPSYATAVLSKP